MSPPRTLLSKIYDRHQVADLGGGDMLMYVDFHLVHEVTSPQAFEGLRQRGVGVHAPAQTLTVADHNVPTLNRAAGVLDPESRAQIEQLQINAAEFGLPWIPLDSVDQGIVHVVGPEQGLTLPGTTIVCGDSHTATHGAFGALAFGIGTTEVEHVLATQTLVQKRAKSMLVQVEGALGRGMTAKDLILAIIGRIGANGATSYIIEYAGQAIRDLDMAGRMTVCNMSIEAGARAGLIAPDETTFAYLKGRRHAPQGAAFDAAVADWRTLASDPRATYDAVVRIDAGAIEPMVTWGSSPEAVISIGGRTPNLSVVADAGQRAQIEQMLAYMGLSPNQPLDGLPVDTVFIGSCTNGRLEDLRAAADIARGRHVAERVRALVVPGSGHVKAAAEAEGLDRVFIDAGFEWRDAGCSMCLGMNPDRLAPGERCASTSNRNFEGRQGPGGRTHLVSPSMAAAAAVAGRLVDVRSFG